MLFMVLGFLVATLIHGALEIPLLFWMQADLEMGQTNWLWEIWPMTHQIGGVFLWLSGTVIGFFLGKKFWRILYIEKRYGTPRW